MGRPRTKERKIPVDEELLKTIKPNKKACIACPPDNNLRNLSEFYTSYSKLNADGKVPICKNCILNLCYEEKTDDISLEKFKEVLMRIDKPFITLIWQSSIDQYNKLYEGKNVSKGNRKKIISYYFKNINSLRQYVSMGWNDGLAWESEKGKVKIDGDVETAYTQNEDNQLIYSEQWRGSFTQSDLNYLDKYYNGLQRDYKIITENHRDYARKIAKASLQMDKCFDEMMSGVKDADKKYDNAKSAFDTLCKSAKFSESTRSLNDVGISSFSVITDKVEAHNWIPAHIPLKKDDIDKMLDALAVINKSV